MINKTLFIYNSFNLFNILNEIKENFYFELKYIDSNNYKKINFEKYESLALNERGPSLVLTVWIRTSKK